MTDLLVRPATGRDRGEPAPEHSSSLVVAGLGAAVAAAATGLLAVLVPVVILWALEPQEGPALGAPVRAAADLWLLGHGSGLHVTHGSGSPGAVGLIPLGLTLPFVALLVRAGRRTSVRGPAVVRVRHVLACAAAVALPYALLAGLVAGAFGTASVSADPWRAALGALVLAFTCTLAGAAQWRPWRDASRLVAAVIRGAATAVLVLLGGGAVLAGTSLAVHGGAATSIAHETASGAIGATGLLAVSLCLLPNAVVWGLSYTLGTGFSVGVGTAVGPFGTHLGLTPGLPLLAALPTGHPPGWAPVVLLLPLLAGALAMRVAARWTAPGSAEGDAAGDASGGYRYTAALGAGCAVLAGVVVSALTALSGGSVAAGRLSTVGPSAWTAALACAGGVGLGAVAAGSVSVFRRRRAADDSDKEADSASDTGSVPDTDSAPDTGSGTGSGSGSGSHPDTDSATAGG